MTRQYKAFISYSWSDKQWAGWLHRALETYHTPQELVGQPTANGGEVPARLHPIFKDREEEAAGHGITAAIEAGMAASEFLIVVCSPRSAKSQWVGKEVAWFKRNRDPRKILAIVVDGEPGATFVPGREDEECFPQALLFKVDEALGVTSEREDSPLAADARYEGDGRNGAKLKLAAAMLGVGLDDLVKRDERRQARRTRMIVTASLALALVMSVLAVVAITSRNAAVAAKAEVEFQRGEADGLIEFMLTDLRKKLEPVGRLDALDVVGQRALKYYAGQKPEGLDANALGRRSRALHLVGEVRDLRGDSEAALKAFRQAAATTKELLARDPKNGQRIFDHAQSVYWVGYVAYQRGEVKEAEARFRDYKRYAEQLVALDPKDTDWQMELSYAESNLGTLLNDEERYIEAEPAFSKALQIVETVSNRDPGDVDRKVEWAQAISWVALAHRKLDQDSIASELLDREVKLYEEILDASPDNTTAMRGMVTALSSKGNLDLMAGEIDIAIDQFKQALRINSTLLNIEPDNSDWLEIEVRTRISFIKALVLAHKRRESKNEFFSTAKKLDRLATIDPRNVIRNIGLRGHLEVIEGAILAAGGETQKALQHSLTAVDTLKKLNLNRGGDGDSMLVLATAQLQVGDLYAQSLRKREARETWIAATAAIRGEDENLRSPIIAVRYALLKRLGRNIEASKIKKILDERGYRHPDYVNEKRR